MLQIVDYNFHSTQNNSNIILQHFKYGYFADRIYEATWPNIHRLSCVLVEMSYKWANRHSTSRHLVLRHNQTYKRRRGHTHVVHRQCIGSAASLACSTVHLPSWPGVNTCVCVCGPGPTTMLTNFPTYTTH